MYTDPEDDTNMVMVARHKQLKPYVAELAIAAIDRMLARQAEEDRGEIEND